jgi:uncharacterized membrane protein YGL010W
MSLARQGWGAANKVALIHVGSWIAQFYGHGVHEKRAPALLDNLLGGTLYQMVNYCLANHAP